MGIMPQAPGALDPDPADKAALLFIAEQLLRPGCQATIDQTMLYTMVVSDIHAKTQAIIIVASGGSIRIKACSNLRECSSQWLQHHCTKLHCTWSARGISKCNPNVPY